MARTDAIEPVYGDVPRDAAGVPAFLILSGSERKWYDRVMRACEAGWREAEDPWAIAEAMTMTVLHRQVAPAWLDEAVWLLACERRTKKHAKRAQDAHVRFMRYQVVLNAQAGGKTWEEACEHAAKVLAGTPAAAEADTVWQSYKAVRKDLKAGRGGLYFTPHKQNRSRLPGV
jgi:hypothetical protein